MVGVGGGCVFSFLGAVSTAEVISSWCFARFFVVSGAAGAVVVGLRVSFVRDIFSSASDMSTLGKGSSDKRSLLSIILPSLLRSLIGGVCNRVMLGGTTGAVAVTPLLLWVGSLGLDRSFMFPRVQAVPERYCTLRSVKLGISYFQGQGYSKSCRSKDFHTKAVKLWGSGVFAAADVTSLTAHLKTFDRCMRKPLVGSKQRQTFPHSAAWKH